MRQSTETASEMETSCCTTGCKLLPFTLFFKARPFFKVSRDIIDLWVCTTAFGDVAVVLLLHSRGQRRLLCGRGTLDVLARIEE